MAPTFPLLTAPTGQHGNAFPPRHFRTKNYARSYNGTACRDRDCIKKVNLTKKPYSNMYGLGIYNEKHGFRSFATSQNAKNIVFETLRPRDASKTSFSRLCDPAMRQKHCFRDFATPQNAKNVVFEALRPCNAPKTLFLKLCGPRFVPFRGLNDLSRPRFIPLRTLNDPLRARFAPLRALNDPLRPRFVPLRGLNAHCDLALCQNHPTISSPVARKTRKMRESA